MHVESNSAGVEGVAMGRKDMRPLLLNVGVAFFLSFASFLYGHLRSRSHRRHGRPPQGASGAGVEAGREAGGGFKEELPHPQSEEAPSNVNDGTSVKGVTSPTLRLSPCGKNFGDEGYLLPEFNELVRREFESFGLEPDAPKATSTRRLLQDKEEKASEKEVVALKNLAQLLQERVESLEMQLLEYYGLKEQDSTVHELENHLKVNTMEAKLLSLKIESLKAENRRLGAQVSDYSRIKAELESARTKIKHLERKLELDSVQANEKVAELHHRIAALQYREFRGEEDNGEAEEKLKHSEDEAAELRSANSKLAMENTDLAAKLSTPSLTFSALESTEATKGFEEVNRLKQANDKLTKEITQLQIDHCAVVEELVYLRWVNACLRYELRNYQPPPGKPVARDLNKTLSPKSEQKAKQLILEYANSDINEKNINLMDFDSEYCSSSQSSSLTENGEVDDSSIDVTVTKNSSSNKTKFLKKLKRLVRGKDVHHNRISSMDRSPTSCGTLERRASVSTCSFDDMMDRSSYESVASCITSDIFPGNQLMAIEGKVHEPWPKDVPWTRNLSRVSLDFRRLKSQEEFGKMRERSKSDVGSSYWHMMSRGDGSLLGSPLNVRLDREMLDLSDKLEMKHGHASNSPSGKPKQRARSASFSSY